MFVVLALALRLLGLLWAKAQLRTSILGSSPTTNLNFGLKPNYEPAIFGLKPNYEPAIFGLKPNYEPAIFGLKPNYEPAIFGLKPNYEPVQVPQNSSSRLVQNL